MAAISAFMIVALILFVGGAIWFADKVMRAGARPKEPEQ